MNTSFAASPHTSSNVIVVPLVTGANRTPSPWYSTPPPPTIQISVGDEPHTPVSVSVVLSEITSHGPLVRDRSMMPPWPTA